MIEARIASAERRAHDEIDWLRKAAAAEDQIAYDELTTDAGTPSALDAFEKLESTAKTAGSMDTAALAQGFIAYHYGAKKEWQQVTEHMEQAVKGLEGSKSPFLVQFLS